jgi:hypothetical protein
MLDPLSRQRTKQLVIETLPQWLASKTPVFVPKCYRVFEFASKTPVFVPKCYRVFEYQRLEL